MIKVLIVEDSEVQALLLKTLLENESDIQVIGRAKNGKQAIALTKNLQPDIITMDIEMPEMNGVEATQHIMRNTPTPIVVVSSRANDSECGLAFSALESGALTLIQKPVNPNNSGFNEIKEELLNAIRNMSQIKVIKRRKKIEDLKSTKKSFDQQRPQLIALGVSTGGPILIKDILSNIQEPLPVPVIIVQHLSRGFLSSYIHWLSQHTQHPIYIPEPGEMLEAGRVYFPSDDRHILLGERDGKLIVKLVNGDKVNGFCPSIDVLFKSIASLSVPVLAGLLTGMGKDGAEGLLEIYKKEQHSTFAQSEESCVVYGMPKAAKALGAVGKMVAANDIAKFVLKKVLS